MNLVADLDKRDAELFLDLCRFVWTISGRMCPLIFDEQADIYTQHRINFETIGHLESLGLIHFAGITDFTLIRLPKSVVASYYGRRTMLTLPNEQENIVSQGKVMLTQAGIELARIVESSPIEAFFDYVYGKWEEKSIVPSRKPQK